MTIEEDKEEIEKRVRIWNKRESYNKKAIEIGKKALEKLYYESSIKIYQFYPYDQLIELFEGELKINMDCGLLHDIVNELVDKDKEYWVRKTEGIYFQE